MFWLEGEIVSACVVGINKCQSVATVLMNAHSSFILLLLLLLLLFVFVLKECPPCHLVPILSMGMRNNNKI